MALDTDGNEIEVTEDNASEVARLEIAQENETPEALATRLAEELKTKEDGEATQQEEDDLIAADETTLDDDKKAQRQEIIDKRAKDNENGEKSDADLLAAKEEDLSDTEKEKVTVLKEAQATERKRLLDTKEEELSDDDKENKKTVLLQIETEGKAAFDIKVADYAKTKEIPIEDARKTLESISGISKKYENDPDKIAEANLGLQRLVSQKDEAIQAARTEASQPRKPQSAREWETIVLEGKLVNGKGELQTSEQVAEAYRELNPETADLENEAVIKLVSKEIHIQSTAFFKEQEADLKGKANDKRDAIIKAIPDSDKDFADPIKKLLKTVSDEVIMRESYDGSSALQWARGGHFSPTKIAEIEKAAEERGFKRGQANGKVITGIIGKGNPPANKLTPKASPAQVTEAMDMFPGKEEKEAVELYMDVKKDRENNKKK